MSRIVFREDGCQVVDDKDFVLFTGGYSACEDYLDVQENLSRCRAAARHSANRPASLVARTIAPFAAALAAGRRAKSF